MGICSAYGCSNRTNRKRKHGVSFHKFPKDTSLKEQWVKAVRRLNWEPGVHSLLCSEHFSGEFLNRTSACGRTELRENAVPTIFSTYPGDLKPQILVQVMPGRRCSVLNCTSNSITNKKCGIQKSFFRFPRDENLRKKWALVCHKKILNLATALVCADHFKEEDYAPHAREALRPKRLKADVIPSVNVWSGVLPPKKFSNKSSNKENSNLRKRESVGENCDSSKKKPKKKCTNNTNSKAVKRKGSELTCVKENAKEPPKKKAILRKTTEENSNDASKRKLSTGSTYNKKPKEKNRPKISKGEIVEKSQEPSKKHITMNEEKGQLKKNMDIVDLKESSKLDACLKTPKVTIQKNGAGNDSEDSIEESKFINRGSDTEKNSTKTPSSNEKSYQDSKGVKILNRARNKENSKQVVKIKNSSRNCDGEPMQKIALGCTDGANSKRITKKKVSFEDISGQSQIIPIVRDIKEKTLKRKETMKNGISRKNYKKRIRLGKDDTDDEESPYGNEAPIINKFARDKVTYNSPSEMAHNTDLLKYLSYLKEKSRNSDQPILFLADK